jgi:four helix bundle protein
MNDDRFSGSEGIDGFDKSDDASRPRRFEHLPAWRAAMELVQEVYEATKGKPLEETAGVAEQMRGTAILVPSKIAASVGSGDPDWLIHNLGLAYGALSELRTLCYVAHDMGEIDSDVAERLAIEATRVSKLIAKMTDNLPAAHPGPNGRGGHDRPSLDN